MLGSFLYGTSTKLTMTLGGLASSISSGWISTAVNNATGQFVEIIIQVRFTLDAGTPSADQMVYVYVYGSEDGSKYTDDISGVSSAYTQRSPHNMLLLQTIATVTPGSILNVSQPMALSLVFSGMIPRRWGIYLRNTTGLPFLAGESGHGVYYTGLKVQNV